MVAPGAKSEDSEQEDCDKVSRRLYNLRLPFPTVEEGSDDASEDSEPRDVFSGMSRDTQDLWNNNDDSRSSKAYQRMRAEDGALEGGWCVSITSKS